jgi:predicted PurR-regulated permease PerM
MPDTESHIDGGIREAAKRSVPWPTIWGTIASVIVTIAAIQLLMEVQRVLTWLAIAVFLAVALNPLVEMILKRFDIKRGFAVSIVIVVVLLTVFGIIFAFAYPLVTEGQQFAKDWPHYLEDVKAGKGPVGEILQRYDLQDKITEHEDQIQEQINQLGSRSLKYVGTVGNFVVGTLTVFVITFLLLFEGPVLLNGVSGLLPDRSRDRVSKVATDCGRAVTGYVAGNLFISVIAAVLTYLFLLVFGVPFKAVLAMFIAIIDLVPLVGATIGATVVILVSFIHSPPAGIAALIFFIVYQQIENHVLQPVVQARTVKLLPITVLVSVLIGTELAGMVGALLAIPVAAMIKVIAKDLWDGRRVRLGAEPETEPVIDADTKPDAAPGIEPATS